MRIVTGLDAITTREPTVLAVGVFDGVHIGHQRLMQRTGELATERQARAVAITWWPHPLHVLRPQEPLELLTTLDQKLDMLAALAVLDMAVVVPFTAELAALPPEDLLARLQQRFDVRAMVQGPAFAFGQDGAATLDWLRGAGARAGFAVESLDISRDGAPVSSGRIRALLHAGDVATATELLGQPYTLEGTVALGDQRGRLLGFPTANLRLDPVHLVPANGVYAVRVGLPGEPAPQRAGVANIGVRPTFGADNARLVEVHLLDATLDLYDQTLRTAFVARLRAEQRFPNLEALQAQIAADAAQARTLLEHANDVPTPRHAAGEAAE